jgi:hypothetical protein
LEDVMPVPGAALPLDDLVEESQRVLAAARAKGVVVRLAGGLAIRHLCPAARTPQLTRTYADLDLAIVGAGVKPLTDLMVSIGYEAAARFNALNGHVRLQFNDVANERHVDVFVDAVRMCHTIDFRNRLRLAEDTLTATDLLLTKLQIVQLNHKDLLDVIALLYDQPLGLGADGIDVGHLERVWGEDWPLWKTSQLTLDKIIRDTPSIVDAGGASRVGESVKAMQSILESGAKTLRWRLRARVGERVRWYELPEELG